MMLNIERLKLTEKEKRKVVAEARVANAIGESVQNYQPVEFDTAIADAQLAKALFYIQDWLQGYVYAGGATKEQMNDIVVHLHTLRFNDDYHLAWPRTEEDDA